MKAGELSAIRLAIDDVAAPYTHSDADIGTIYDLFNGAIYRVIAHFLLADALAIQDPVAPAVPDLDGAPTFLSNLTVQTWTTDNRQRLDKFSQELALYRAKVDLNRSRMDILRAQSDIYRNLEGGY